MWPSQGKESGVQEKQGRQGKSEGDLGQLVLHTDSAREASFRGRSQNPSSLGIVSLCCENKLSLKRCKKHFLWNIDIGLSICPRCATLQEQEPAVVFLKAGAKFYSSKVCRWREPGRVAGEGIEARWPPFPPTQPSWPWRGKRGSPSCGLACIVGHCTQPALPAPEGRQCPTTGSWSAAGALVIGFTPAVARARHPLLSPKHVFARLLHNQTADLANFPLFFVLIIILS